MYGASSPATSRMSLLYLGANEATLTTNASDSTTAISPMIPARAEVKAASSSSGATSGAK